MSDRDELRRLAEAATPGPWRRSVLTIWGITPTGRTRWQSIANTRGAKNGIDNANYIAATDPQTILALLDAADRGDRAIELLRAIWHDGGTSESNLEDRTLAGYIKALLAEVDA